MSVTIVGHFVCNPDGSTSWLRQRYLSTAETPLWWWHGEWLGYRPVDGPKSPSAYHDEPMRWADDGGANAS